MLTFPRLLTLPCTEFLEYSAQQRFEAFCFILQHPYPSRLLSHLRDQGYLAALLPEIDQLFGVPQPARYHPEIDCGFHALLVMEQAALLSDSLRVRLGALVHDLGKGITPAHMLPSHCGHEHAGLPLTAQLCERFGVPSALREFALLVTQYHGLVHQAFDLRPKTILDFFHALKAYAVPENLADLLLCALADARGRPDYEASAYPQKEYLWRCFTTARTLQQDALAFGWTKDRLIQQQVSALKVIRKSV
jgi:tRNA nucleotidyltransferase/poly(A) polymerase